MSDEIIIDVEELLERVADDQELLLELLDLYVDDYVGKRIALEENMKQNNPTKIENIAHSLKGASGNISAKALRDIFYKLEGMGKSQDLTGAEELLPILDAEYAKLTECIGQLKQRFSS